MSKISIAFHGAALRVTGSCALVKSDNQQVLIDCGLIQGDEDAADLNREGFPFDPKTLDAVVLTHAHLDHVGRLPVLVEQGFSGPIFTHRASAELAEVIWRDAARLSAREGSALYPDSAIEESLKLIRPLSYAERLAFKGMEIEFLDAGHILGSGHVQIDLQSKRLLMSGDVGQVDTPIIRDPNTRWNDRMDCVVIESTYGNRLHKGREETLREFTEIVRRAVRNRGMILIPAFAIGRTQELLYHINNLVKSRQLPRLPVLLDSPMAGRVTSIYRTHQECYDAETWENIREGRLPLSFEWLRELSSVEDSRSVAKLNPPAIVIAGSGMCTGGRILHHLKNFLDQESTTVIFVGWQGSGTLGRRLVNGEKKVKLLGEEIKVRAKIETLNGFSAHADQNGLLSWAKNIPGSPRWLVNHGEEEAAAGLAVAMKSAGLGEAQVVTANQSYEI